jgi:hypothetical protein
MTDSLERSFAIFSSFHFPGVIASLSFFSRRRATNTDHTTTDTVVSTEKQAITKGLLEGGGSRDDAVID